MEKADRLYPALRTYQSAGVKLPLLVGASLLLGAAPDLVADGIPEHMKVTRVIAFDEGSPAMGWGEFEYRFTIPDNGWIWLDTGGAIGATNGTRFMAGGDDDIGLSLTHLDGLAFDLMELDLAEYNTLEVPEPVRFEGRKDDGTVLSFTVPLDGVIDGNGPIDDFQKVTFPPEWTGLVELRILSSGWAIDNIKVRGLAVETGHESANSLPVPLQVLGTLANNANTLFWRVGEFKGSKLVIHERNFSLNRTRIGLFDPANGAITNLKTVSGEDGGNPLTGETCWVYPDGRLLINSGGTTKELAREGQNGVNTISYPAVSNGKVIFANLDYEGNHGQFSVVMASSTGVATVLTPATVLADGGTVIRIPNAMHFSGNTFAIPSATTKTGDCFLVSFNGGPIQISPGVGKKVPGTNFTISERRALLWLDDTSLGYIVRSGGTEPRDHIITMLANGSSTAASWDPHLAKSILPGSGLALRNYGAAGLDRSNGTIFITGPLECRDVAPNNLNGIVARTSNGVSTVLVREGSVVPGFGPLKSIYPIVTVGSGEFYFTAMNEVGTVAVLKGRVPLTIPQLKTGGFVTTADGSVRFMVENLTHGLPYRVESAPSPAGPWTECSRFTGGSRSRSVFGAFQRGTQEFFRVVED